MLHEDETRRPYELLILDAPTIQDAVNVWRWNVNGLGFSKNGYNGPYETAITADGQIVAGFITSGSLIANIIKAGVIQSQDGSSWWDLESGEVMFSAYATTGSLDEVNNRINQFQQSVDGLNSYVANMTESVENITGDLAEEQKNIRLIEGQISELQQTVDGLSLTVQEQYSGGINFVRNSAGLNGLSNDWTYSGTVTAQQGAETKNSTVSNSCSDNVKWSIKRRFQNGTFKLIYPPYGYLWDGNNLVIEPKQAETIKHIFSDVLSGKGVEMIAKELNAQNIPSKKDGRWTPTTIRGILSNEKYVGDVIFQKTYTDERLARHRNTGQQDMYMITEHHPEIISREDFEAVQCLTAQRAKEKGVEKGASKYQKRYAFSGKIICGECGDTFKRRIHSGPYENYAAWCCNTHLSDKASCSMKYIRDDALQMAFVTMLNKLIYSHKLVLKPYQRAIANNSKDKALGQIQRLERLLEQNLEQRETLMKLMTQGYIDQVLYNRENNALLAQADEYRANIEAINTNMTGDVSKLSETAKLLRFAEKNDMLQAFDETLFSNFVDHIQVFNRSEIGFVLKCGLTFKERIGE